MPPQPDATPRATDADDATASLRAALPASEPALRSFLRRAGVAAGALDDVVQEAFARAWRSRAGLDRGRALEPWLFAIGLRAWLDLRARARRLPASGPAAEPAAEPTDFARVDARLDVEQLLARLPRTERLLLARFHRDGASLETLAAELGMPLNTVKSHLHRARRRLAAWRPAR
ncbi:MAG: sigma-70 family RNA polymerase sigma factor [Planctomycetes bacterium]|nr:sigma-70 family RNA polymerase sigma factor [Planctomycetota bacterium]